MVNTEIIVAFIGSSVTLISPFIALFIRKYCEKEKKPINKDTNPVNEEKKPINKDSKPINKDTNIEEKKPINKDKKNDNDIESQKEKPKTICEINKTFLPAFGAANIQPCNDPNKKICKFCGLTFCQHHFHVNNNVFNLVGGHVCSGSRQ